MDIKNLKYFVGVARYGSINKAAKEMFISQPQLSHIIQSIEEEAGFALIQRTSQGSRLTQNGENFLQHCKVILNEMDSYDPVISYAQDGAYAALLYPDGAIEVFRKGEEKAFLLNTQFYNEPTAFGIFGDRMVAADIYGRIMFQDLKDGSMNLLDADGIYRVFMFEGNFLAAGRNNGTVVDVFDVEKGERLFSMQNSAGFARIGFSEDGEYAVGLCKPAPPPYWRSTDLCRRPQRQRGYPHSRVPRNTGQSFQQYHTQRYRRSFHPGME